MIKSAIGDSTTVAAWLASLDASNKDAFIHYAKNTTSDIEAYLYARFLRPGYTGSIADLTAWIKERFPKEDLRKVLLREIDDLQIDIRNVRDMVQNQMLDPASAATKNCRCAKRIAQPYSKCQKYFRWTGPPWFNSCRRRSHHPRANQHP
jgi:hypothetical protein